MGCKNRIIFIYLLRYDTAAYFDKIPPPENGGTYLVIRGETLTPDEWFERQEELRREKERMKNNPALAEKQRAEKEKAKKAAIEAAKKEKERLKKEAAEAKKNKPKDEPFKFKESTGIPAILDAESQYAEDWRSGLEKEHNPKRNTFMEPVTEQWIYELQLKVREEVDVLMRLELIMLEKALCRDTRKKYKKPKNPRKGKSLFKILRKSYLFFIILSTHDS